MKRARPVLPQYDIPIDLPAVRLLLCGAFCFATAFVGLRSLTAYPLCSTKVPIFSFLQSDPPIGWGPPVIPHSDFPPARDRGMGTHGNGEIPARLPLLRGPFVVCARESGITFPAQGAGLGYRV